MAREFVVGGVAAMSASTVTHPIDLLKVRERERERERDRTRQVLTDGFSIVLGANAAVW
jgi:hypothetical protein